MRTLATHLLLLLASLTVVGCSVSDKQPSTGDAGGDATPPLPGDATPDTTLTAAPPQFSDSATATFEFESNVAGATFACSLDGEAGIPCTSPFVRTLDDGTHSFSVKAINGVGDADDTPAEHLWSIDTVAPETTLTEAPPAADNSTSVRFRFISNEMNTSFECSLDSAPFAACASGDEVGPITDGPHAFAVRAKDRAGNVDASPAVHAWEVDTSTPDTTLVAGPIGATASASATFEFLSPDAGPGATFTCSLDGSPFASCTSPKTYSGLGMGTHTFSVRVTDANNNVDPTPATRTWTIDGTPPQTTITEAPSGAVTMASVIIAFTANESEVTYACSLDGAAPSGCTSPFSATGLGQGAHTFSVTATDLAGNTDPTPATATWTVDTVSPDIALTGPTEGATVGPRLVFSWTASEGTVECQIDGGAWAACTSPRAFNLPAGGGSFAVRSVDEAGNTTLVTRTFTVACAAPDATGAAGLLHLDDSGQLLANATGGAGATLGPTDQAETQDPALATGRFAGGAVLTAAESDQIAWPLALGAQATFSVELWSRPDALGGTRDVLVSGDGRVAIRVAADGATSVRYVVTVIDAQSVMHTVTSGAYPATQWHLIDVTLAEPALRLWVDGDRSEAGDVTLGTPAALDALRLGGSYGGDLDEVVVTTAAFATDEDVLVRYCPAATPRL